MFVFVRKPVHLCRDLEHFPSSTERERERETQTKAPNPNLNSFKSKNWTLKPSLHRSPIIRALRCGKDSSHRGGTVRFHGLFAVQGFLCFQGLKVLTSELRPKLTTANDSLPKTILIVPALRCLGFSLTLLAPILSSGF